MSKLKKNFIYQVTYQIFIIIVPLITAPYISRILGSENIGIQSYIYTIINYFVIFIMLGLNTYGNRSIALIKKEGQESINNRFSEIFYTHILLSIPVVILSMVPFFFMNQAYKLIYIVNAFYILGAIFDINWFFFGMEEIKSIVIKNVIVKIISVIIIFTFVKTTNDLWIYSLSLSLSTFIGTIILFWNLRGKVKFVKVKLISLKKHILPLLILFVPLIAINLYKYMDKLMLGWISDMSQLGYYENAEKVINIPNSILNAITLVMLPYCSTLAATGNTSGLIKQLNKTVKFMAFACIPLSLGLAAISDQFSILYFGKDFVSCGILIALLSLTLFPVAISGIIRSQYLMPLSKDKEFIISLFAGAIANLIINLILIWKLAAVGTVIGTIFAEFTVFFVQLYLVRKKINIKKELLFNVPFLIIGIIMFIIAKLMFHFLNISVLNLIVVILVCVAFYCISSFIIIYLFKNDFLYDVLTFLKLGPLAIKITNFKYKKIVAKYINKIEKGSIKYHLSFDDCHASLENLNNFDYLFDEPFFKYLKSLHDKYNINISLNVNNIYDLKKINKNFQDDLLDNTWLTFTFHSIYNKFDTFVPINEIRDGIKFFKYQISKLFGKQSIGKFIRLEGFQGTTEELMEIVNILNSSSFLAPDDTRQSYDLLEFESEYLYKNGYLKKDTITYYKTDFRLEMFGNYSTNENYVHVKMSKPYNEVVYRLLKQQILNNTIIVFTHEWYIYQDYKINEKVGHQLENFCKFINDYKCTPL